MVTIRMRRQGAKKSPFYRLVVIDSHAARDGRAIEVVGHYDPTSQPESLRVDRERLDHWVGRGAQLSDTVRTLLARHPAETEADETASTTDADAESVGS